jgi:hypothetical protein
MHADSIERQGCRLETIHRAHDEKLDLLWKLRIPGYMKKLGPLVLRAFEGRILNTHPALVATIRRTGDVWRSGVRTSAGGRRGGIEDLLPFTRVFRHFCRIVDEKPSERRCSPLRRTTPQLQITAGCTPPQPTATCYRRCRSCSSAVIHATAASLSASRSSACRSRPVRCAHRPWRFVRRFRPSRTGRTISALTCRSRRQ